MAEFAALTARGLRGSVVLVNLRTFSCINSSRVLPCLRAWAAKYKNLGLVVIGVQAPDLEFEKSADNVRCAVKDRMIDFPVAIDNVRCSDDCTIYCTNRGQREWNVSYPGAPE